MTTVEVVRIVVEAIGILTFIGGGVWYLAKLAWRGLDKLDHQTGEITALTSETKALKEHQASMNGHLTEHTVIDDTRFSGISERLSHIEGRLGLPLRSDIEEKK